MLSCQILSSSSSTTHRLLTSRTLSSSTASALKVASSSLRLPELSIDEPFKSEYKSKPNKKDVIESNTKKLKKDVMPSNQDEDEDERISISRIQVPRQKHIRISKAELLDAIVSKMLHSQDDKDQFLLISSCLDSILHAEHKSILEEMRTDYCYTDSLNDEGLSSSETELVMDDNESKLDQVVANVENSDSPDSASDTINGNGGMNRFGEVEGQESELDKLLPFSYGLDLWNLLGSSVKNVKSYSDRESRLAVATRFQRAFMQLLHNAQFEELSAEDLKLTSALNSDYLLNLPIYVDWKRASESNAIIFRRGYATERQKGLLIVAKLDYLQSRLLQRIFFVISKPLGKVGKWISEALSKACQTEEVQEVVNRMKLWLEELSLFRQSYFSNEQTSDNLLGADQLSDGELPIWLAAQRAVSRYEGFLSPVGPRGRLLRKLLKWIGLAPSTPETPFQLETDSNASEPYSRPISLSRISLSDIWRPATGKYCGKDIWKMLKTSVSILLSQSILQEPAFQELILLYTDDMDEKETKDKDEVRLDVASILGLLAYFINYKFENISSSPSAIFLDVIAISALIIYVTRVALGYKQTWDRYQLLVNKTLYEKTLASGFGSVHFLLDASEQQQVSQMRMNLDHQGALSRCRSLVAELLKTNVEMPIDKAANILVRLGMAREISIDGRFSLQATPCQQAYEALQERWDGLLG
ncbi:DUF3754 family protein [Citrus sinensis]|uniref:DUF3754 family protein n=1 Tax=Citrus sinensis TaxID=2711 RepID=A0ACB8MMH8_CITSI|nr:DUF3754 family protein [Citrus sinensis]